MTSGGLTVVDCPILYDWLYQDELDDIQMYIQLSANINTVLECGIGSGRIAIPMASAGKIVYGIDNSTAMLERLQTKLAKYPKNIAKRVHPYYADMTDFELGRKFDFIYVPFSTFNYLLTIDAQRACLQSIRKHLTQNGILVLEILSFQYKTHWLCNDPILRKIKTGPDLDDTEIIELWETSTFDCVSQIVIENRYFRYYSVDGELQKEKLIFWKNRFFLLGEIKLLLDEADFKIISTYGDFHLNPYKHGSEIVIIVVKTNSSNT